VAGAAAGVGRLAGYSVPTAQMPATDVLCLRVTENPMVVDARHESIKKLVRRIRSEMNSAVPDIDPDAAGIDAHVLVVLRDPGRLGALTTNYLSVLKNPDRTAANQRRLFTAAKLPIEACLFWNAIPWDLGGRAPRTSDLETGARYLIEHISLMPHPPVVVACGREAQQACARAGVEAINICHPSDRGLRGGGVNREPAHIAGLQEAARRARFRGQPARPAKGRDEPARRAARPEEPARHSKPRERPSPTRWARGTTRYMRDTSDAGRRALAREIAELRKAGVPWDGIEGIVARGLVSGAPQGRALMRRYGLVDAAGGIRDSYTTYRDGRPRKEASVN
jgi:hypothetical protein